MDHLCFGLDERFDLNGRSWKVQNIWNFVSLGHWQWILAKRKIMRIEDCEHLVLFKNSTQAKLEDLVEISWIKDNLSFANRTVFPVIPLSLDI